MHKNAPRQADKIWSFGKRHMTEQQGKAQGAESCPVKRQRIVAGLLLILVLFVNVLSALVTRDAGLARLQRGEIEESIAREPQHWTLDDIAAWHLYEASPWVVGRVQSHVWGLERTLTDFGYTSVRERVELAPDRHMVVPLLSADLVGYQSTARGEPLNEMGRPLRWRGAMRDLEVARKMHARTRQEKVSPPYFYVSRARGLGLKGPILVYLPEVRRVAARYNIPVHLLLAVMQVESGGRHETTSSRNAVGLMQVQPETAGVDVHRYLLGKRGEEAHNAEEFAGHVLLADIEQNILYGASYLHLLEKVYFRNINDKEARTLCILAAYNMGPGRFTRLFAENPDEAIRIINLYSNIGLYEEIKLRYGNKNYTYIDKVITLMLQYQKRGY